MGRGSTCDGFVRNSRRRGVALILVLGLLLILGGVATDIWRSARLDAGIVESLRARTVARYAAESGIEAAVRSRSNLVNVALGDARFSVVITNLNARIDLGRTDSATVRGLFQQYTSESQARAIAKELVAHPLERMGELALIPGVPEDVAPYVTVWGDGTIDTTAAPQPVRVALSSAAALVDRPSRLLLIARGWRSGFPLIHEIQAVYEVQGPTPVLVAWQERDL
jgi:type II secretory pathway component PulK